jgi:hypothetical protein
MAQSRQVQRLERGQGPRGLRLMGVVAVAVALVLAVGGCGSGGDSELAAAVGEEFKQILPLDDEQASCIGTEMVDLYGAEEMQRFVDEPETFLPTEEASVEDTANVLDTCGIEPLSLVRDTTLDELPDVELPEFDLPEGDGPDVGSPGAGPVNGD